VLFRSRRATVAWVSGELRGTYTVNGAERDFRNEGRGWMLWMLHMYGGLEKLSQEKRYPDSPL